MQQNRRIKRHDRRRQGQRRANLQPGNPRQSATTSPLSYAARPPIVNRPNRSDKPADPPTPHLRNELRGRRWNAPRHRELSVKGRGQCASDPLTRVFLLLKVRFQYVVRQETGQTKKAGHGGGVDELQASPPVIRKE